MKNTKSKLGLTLEEYEELVSRRTLHACLGCGKPGAVHATTEEMRELIMLCDDCYDSIYPYESSEDAEDA